jgi:hypothetical protein
MGVRWRRPIAVDKNHLFTHLSKTNAQTQGKNVLPTPPLPPPTLTA